jgi:hypothetical protein
MLSGAGYGIKDSSDTYFERAIAEEDSGRELGAGANDRCDFLIYLMILSLHAVVAVNDPDAGDRGAVRRQGHFFTLSHRCRAPHPVPSGHPI